MAAKLKSFNAQDNSVATINRMYQNVKEAFEQDDTADRVAGVQIIQSTATTSSYGVNKNDGFLVVNARGGPMRIVLPVPARQTQAVHILNGENTANAVTVAQADGKAMGNAPAVITLAPNESALMVCTGNAWFRS